MPKIVFISAQNRDWDLGKLGMMGLNCAFQAFEFLKTGGLHTVQIMWDALKTLTVEVAIFRLPRLHKAT